VLDERQQANQTALDTGRDAAKTNYLSLLQSLKTPEELAAAQADGRIASALGALDPTRRAEVLGEDENRLAEVRTRTTQGQEFDRAQDTEAARPVIDAANAAIAARAPNAAELIDQVPVQFRASLLDANRQAGRGDSEW